jgi:hypothetical protein
MRTPVRTEHPANRFDASYPEQVVERAARIIRSGRVKLHAIRFARLEELLMLEGGDLAVAVAEETRDMSANDAALVIDAIQDYARARATRDTDDIVDFD